MLGGMKFTPEKVSAFLHVLSESCNVGKACAAIDVSRRAAYNWRNEKPEFACAWDEAVRIGVTALEDEAHRRAFEGVDKPIVHKGVVTNTMKDYSDTLAIFLLKAHDPDKYRENSKVELAGSIDVGKMSDAELDAELAALTVAGIVPGGSGADDLV